MKGLTRIVTVNNFRVMAHAALLTLVCCIVGGSETYAMELGPLPSEDGVEDYGRYETETGMNVMAAANSVTLYTIGAGVSPAGGGSIEGGGRYKEGSSVTVRATPNTGYQFVNWTEDGVEISANAGLTFTVTADHILVANFALKTFTITATAGPGGRITPPSVITEYGSRTSFTVTADPGNHIAIEGRCSGSLDPSTGIYTIDSVTNSCAVEANFVPGIWTRMGGSDTVNATPVHGVLGEPAAENTPGGRQAGKITWQDADGNPWIFGGARWNNTTKMTERLNDLWKYDISSGEWAWMGGNTSGNSAGLYGERGTNAAGNWPGARNSAAGWVDAKGNFWLFGGWGYDAVGTYGRLNDLWKYESTSGLWTWMGGSDAVDVTGVYGKQGIAAAANRPGARGGSMTWTDDRGNFWLFGGSGVDSSGNQGYLNDLWKYEPVSGLWTWMGGSDAEDSAGVYGVKGIAAVGNVPGARYAGSTWKDASGNLWLFGGYYKEDYFSDLWRYDIVSNQWVWVSGSDVVGATSVYGTMGTPDAANMPGGRCNAANWVDGNSNLWLFGGVGYYTTLNRQMLNQLWKYDPVSNEWTWMGGIRSAYGESLHGTLGEPSAGSAPGVHKIGASWKDANGNFWFFGGYGVGSGSKVGNLNDLWRFTP